MSLDDLLWRRLHLQNVIMKCLSIESVEYAYFIPIVSQLADYWGDRKIACLCKIMSRQVKQHLNHATHIHLLLSPPFRDLLPSRSRKGKQFTDLLRDSRYDNADDRCFFTRAAGNSVSKKQQYSHLLFDNRFKNLFQSINLDPLVESQRKGRRQILLSSILNIFLSRDFPKRILIAKVADERTHKTTGAQAPFGPSLSFRYEPKGQSSTLIGNTYKESFGPSL